jgi:predicted dienelactone hydrolase
MLRLILTISFISLLSACGGGGGGSSSSDVNNLPQLDLPEIKGSLGVGYQKITITDETRNNRELFVDVWYPVDTIDFIANPVAKYDLGSNFSLPSSVAGDSLPISQENNRNLIVFSHGSGGLSTQVYPLMEILASQGFIVAAPTHAGNAVGDNDDERSVQVANRAADMSFVIDQMLLRSNTPGDQFEGRVSAENIGTTGHSFGGSTALGTAVGFGDAPADLRVTATMPVAGFFFNAAAPITETQYKSLNIPTLLLGGTLDESVDIENNREAFAAIDSSPVYNVEIVGAGHQHFTNACDISDLVLDLLSFDALDALVPGAGTRLKAIDEETCVPEAFPIDESLRIQNLYAVAFFKKYLQNDNSFDDYLTERYAELNEPDVTFQEK